MDVYALHGQFKKGVAYFAKQYAEGNNHPLIQKQLADFERQVVVPFDAACAKMTALEREKMEREYVPF